MPICRRTTPKPFHEWICSQHWKNVPKKWKAVKRRTEKRARQEQTEEAWDAYLRIWARCRRYAIEAAFGLA